MAYDDQIMVATGDAEHPGVEEVTLENIQQGGGKSSLFIDSQGYISIDYDYVRGVSNGN